VSFNSRLRLLSNMERDWSVQDGSDCDLEQLPQIRNWPRLSPHVEAVERLVLMGAIEDGPLREVLMRTPRGVHALPLPLQSYNEGLINIESSTLRMPWWSNLNSPNSLLPGVYETAQVIQMLEMEKGDSVMLVAPRGNWWSEILMQLGASRLRIVEVDEKRRGELQKRWNDLRLDIVADACGCNVEWSSISDAYMGSPKNGWDRILVTAGLPRIPVSLLMRLSFEGVAVAAVGEKGGTILQTIERQGEGEFQTQWHSIWNVDMMHENVARSLCDLVPLNETDTFNIQNDKSSRDAWMMANQDATIDRLGSTGLLEMIEEVWNEVEITVDEEDSNLRFILANDLFRMGNVLQRLGLLRVAAEHHGSSFELYPTPEAACYLGMTFSIEEDDGLAWQRKAIETNPNYGGSWNEIGEAFLEMGEANRAIEWFRGAINSTNNCERGAAWANLARAHLELGQALSALFAAQEATTLMPNEVELEHLLNKLSEDLA